MLPSTGRHAKCSDGCRDLTGGRQRFPQGLTNLCIITVYAKNNKRINTRYPVLTFAKPECDNVLQPEPPSGEGCNT